MTKAVFVFGEGDALGSVDAKSVRSVDLFMEPADGLMALDHFDLVVFSPSAIRGGPTAMKRERELRIALRNGKAVVFLTNQETQPSGMVEFIHQFLQPAAIRYERLGPSLCVAVAPEFSEYCDRYGHAMVRFEGGSPEILIRSGEHSTGVAFGSAQGIICCLPAQFAGGGFPVGTFFLDVLFRSLTDWFAVSARSLPSWLQSVQLPAESHLLDSIKRLETELEAVRLQRAALDKYKMILVTKGTPLVEGVMAVLDAILLEDGWKCSRQEQYLEDFWVDRGGAHVVIGEVKGVDGNVRRSHINDLDNHREEHGMRGTPGLSAEFPALLVEDI